MIPEFLYNNSMCAKRSLREPAGGSPVNVIQSERCIRPGMRGEATNPMKPGRESEQAVMRKREGVEPRQMFRMQEGRGVMRSRRQYVVSRQQKETRFLGVRVHGMFTGLSQELGRSPQNRSLVGPFTRNDVTATSVINPHKGERRFKSAGEVRSVRSSAISRPQPVVGKGCG